MTSKKVPLILALLALCVWIPAQANTPDVIVRDAVAELAEALDGREEELADDAATLTALVDKILLPRFDRQYAARLVLAKHWKVATKDQRKQFVDAFYGSLLRRYADGLKKFDSSRVQILPFNGKADARRATVRTMVKLDSGDNVPVNYGLVLRDDGWKVYDVTIEGISYVRNYRTEMDSEIRANGLQAVIDRLQSDAET